MQGESQEQSSSSDSGGKYIAKTSSFTFFMAPSLYVDESGSASGQNEEVGGEEEQTTPTDTPSQSAFPNTQDLFGGDSSYVIM